jgi:tetratricopeptide (TPR) repeat protein
LGKSYYFLENDDSAVHCFNKAIVIKGADSNYIEFNNKDMFNDIMMPELRYSRAIANYQKDNYNGALDDLLFSINANYNKPECYLYVGMIAMEKGNREMACKYLNMAKEKGKMEAIKYLQDCKN